ncbi:FAD/NAD(P)-binding protein [candidate division WOR-3 bacterium]|nr:FAD/NAD(P)-binding protein [candidate division WOR-3 bacterium]
MIQLPEAKPQDASLNPFLPEEMRLVRRYDLTPDVRFFQVRPLDMERALTLDYKPGQFMMISLAGVGEAPFSISSTPSRPGMLEFCIRKVGKVTTNLFQRKENSIIGVRGPYGNGFPFEKMIGNDILIVVGGLGAAPLRSLLLYILDNRDKFGKFYFLHGAKTPNEMLFRKEFFEIKERTDLNCFLTVDEDKEDNWPFHVGLVTDLFTKIEGIDAENTYATVCGPPAMYKFVIAEFLKLGIPKHQVLMTLERRMHCGIGKCGHCAIGPIYTCLDGPVFSYWDVLHMKDLI